MRVGHLIASRGWVSPSYREGGVSEMVGRSVRGPLTGTRLLQELDRVDEENNHIQGEGDGEGER